MATLPACGIYRTGAALGDHIPAGRFVYFHNHGDPGPGVYLPSGWVANRARWHDEGHTAPSAAWMNALEPLPREGFYRVHAAFTCCAKRCRTFEPETLVQLGYDGTAQPIVFLPEWTTHGLALPETGTRVDRDTLANLTPLLVAESGAEPAGDGLPS